MKASEKNIKEIFDFKGLWGLSSKCGLQRLQKGDNNIIIVTELYKDNPGSSITSVSASLAMQIAEKYGFSVEKMIYIESSPDMNSKLSFYDQEYYKVNFDCTEGKLLNPRWEKLTKDDFRKIVDEL